MSQRILLVIGGGISAYKVLDAIRRLRDHKIAVRCILTAAGAQLVTPLTVATLSADRVFQDLFDLTDEHDVGHIKLARDCDLVVVAPATADLIAKMALGLANDLASTALLATDKPILLVPAMNPKMWAHPATQANVATLRGRGAAVLGPAAGAMAERGESGVGRMVEPNEIVAVVGKAAPSSGALAGRHVLVTSGPTREPIDPVRYIANHSSGKQGHAIAAAAAAQGARVTLICGPVRLPDPDGVTTVRIETARDMLAACEKALPADVAIFAAAVADWRVADAATQKIKKTGKGAPTLELTENPDILSTIAHLKAKRPRLVVGFAAETEKVIDNAKDKLARKGCDLIVANDVSPQTAIMGGDNNQVHLISRSGVESWPVQTKEEVAARLVAHLAAVLKRDA